VTVKSIIDIDVNSNEFQQFAKEFAKYKDALAATPSAWAKVNKQTDEIGSKFEKMGRELREQGDISRENDDAEEKRLKRLSTSEKLWTSMSRSGASLAKSVLDVGVGVLKWGSIIAGGLLGGSLFGIDRMARDVSNDRRSAMGIGMSTSEKKAFDINFERLLDSDFPAKIAEMKMDPSKAGPLYALGVDPGGSTQDTLIATIKAMRAKALATPVSQLGMLDQITGMNVGSETWGRFKNYKTGEINSMLAGDKRDIGAVGFSDATGRKWQDFTTQMERAGAQIQKTFVDGLAPLAVPLTHLSQSLVKFLGRLLPTNGKGPIEEGIDTLGHWIDEFSGKIAKPEFLKRIDQFTGELGGLADVIHKIKDIADHPGHALMDAVVTDVTDNQVARAKAMGGLGADIWDWLAHMGANVGVSTTEQKYGLPKGSLAYLWQQESGSSFDSPDKPDGAGGAFHLKRSMAGGMDPHDFDQSKDRVAEILANEMKRNHGDIVKAFKAYDPNVDVSKYNPQGGSNITINNNTGGSATVTVNALAGGP
jgi:uncharacterized protein YukE